MKRSRLVITALMLALVIAGAGTGCGSWKAGAQVEQNQYGKALGEGKLVVSPETETFEIEGTPEFVSKILELIGRYDLPPALKPLAGKATPPQKKKKGWFSE